MCPVWERKGTGRAVDSPAPISLALPAGLLFLLWGPCFLLRGPSQLLEALLVFWLDREHLRLGWCPSSLRTFRGVGAKAVQAHAQ